MRNFGSSAKVARKSHVKKDEWLLTLLKKLYAKNNPIALEVSPEFESTNLYFEDEPFSYTQSMAEA